MTRDREAQIAQLDVGAPLPPIHPGDILWEDFIKPSSLSLGALAKDLGISKRRLQLVLDGNEAVGPVLAQRLGRRFRMSADFWTNLQTMYDTEMTTP